MHRDRHAEQSRAEPSRAEQAADERGGRRGRDEGQVRAGGRWPQAATGAGMLSAIARGYARLSPRRRQDVDP
eukprot:3574553-Prymnesium_polylepis.1